MGKLNPHSHKRLDTRQRIIVGITFFSMFFGAGNLIFPPLSRGSRRQSHTRGHGRFSSSPQWDCRSSA